MEINNFPPTASTSAVQLLQSSQSSKSNEAAELEQQQQNVVANNAQEPQISAEGTRLAAARNANASDGGRATTISNTQEAQQVIDQMRKDMQANQAQALQAQGNVTPGLASSLLIGAN